MNARLLVIDALSIVRRCYEANPTPDGPEKAEGALRAARGSFNRGLHEHAPTHALVAFDVGGLNWRHALYPAYKQDRKPMPAPLAEALPEFKESLMREGWALDEHPGFEADDTFASACYAAVMQDLQVEVIGLSSDKDLAAMSQFGVRIRDHFNGVWRDGLWCEEQFGVGPARLQDWLALVGDKVDGVPGVEGVGRKTATKLLLEYGDLEGVLAAAPGIKGKLGERLVAHADMARLSRQLTALRLNLYPHGLDWDTLQAPGAAHKPTQDLAAGFALS